MDFQRHGKVGAGFDETRDPQFGVTLHPQNLNLDGMHQGMKQGSLRELLVEHDHIEKGQGIHVADLGRFEAEGADLREELRDSHSRAVSSTIRMWSSRVEEKYGHMDAL